MVPCPFQDLSFVITGMTDTEDSTNLVTTLKNGYLSMYLP